MKDETQLLSEIAQAAETLGLLVNELQTMKRPGTTRPSEIPRDAAAGPAQSSSWTIRRSATQASAEETRAGLRQFPLLRGLRSYGMINQKGDLTAILIRGPVTEQQIKELVNASRWAFEKSLTPAEAQRS